MSGSAIYPIDQMYTTTDNDSSICNIVLIIALISLIIYQYVSIDYIKGKNGSRRTENIDQLVDNLCCYSHIITRALIVGIISSVLGLYIIKGTAATCMELLFMTLLVSVIVYYSDSWIITHYIRPVLTKIRRTN